MSLRKGGARSIPADKRRVKIGLSVARETRELLEEIAQHDETSQGKVVDRLIAREHRRIFGAK
jgi:hypothetical protein